MTKQMWDTLVGILKEKEKKSLKKKKSKKSKSTGIKYDVKMGYFCESRCDYHGAIHHYENAYNALLDREAVLLCNLLSIKVTHKVLVTDL